MMPVQRFGGYEHATLEHDHGNWKRMPAPDHHGRACPGHLRTNGRGADSRDRPGHDGVDGPLTASMCQSWVVKLNQREPSMKEISRLGLDLAKSVFQVHGVNAQEQMVLRRSLRRGQMLDWFAKLAPCLIGMEACASAHDWARELTRLGHTVRLMPPSYVKAYVRRNKNDAADAAAICEAVSRPSMRFVAPKTEAQQAATGIHRVREALIKQHTATMNSLRALMGEFGIVAPKGNKGMDALRAIVADPEETRIPDPLRTGLAVFAKMLEQLEIQLGKIDQALAAWSRTDQSSRHLLTIPGFGPV